MDRLERLIDMERSVEGGSLSPAREAALERQRRLGHTPANPRHTCSWCKTVAADASIDRRRYLSG